MLDIIKYLPLGLRLDLSNTDAKGPISTKFRDYEWNLNDSRFTFSAPKAVSILGYPSRLQSPKESINPSVHNICEQPVNGHMFGIYSSRYGWETSFFFQRNYFFVGSWFTGEKMRLIVKAKLISVTPENEKLWGKNFFHPKVFENVVIEHLNTVFGGKVTDAGRARYRGPLNWEASAVKGIEQSAMFDVHKVDESWDDPLFERHILFPVGENMFLDISFDFYGTSLKCKKYNVDLLFDLMNKIIETFKFEAGGSLKREFKTLKDQLGNLGLSKDFGELKWPITEQEHVVEEKGMLGVSN